MNELNETNGSKLEMHANRKLVPISVYAQFEEGGGSLANKLTKLREVGCYRGVL